MNPAVQQILITGAGMVLMYLLAQGKTKAEIIKLKAEAKKTEIDGAQAITHMWKETCQDLRQQVIALQAEVKKLTGEVQTLRLENGQLRDDLPDDPIKSERPVL